VEKNTGKTMTLFLRFLLTVFCLCLSTLSAEIYQIRVTIDGMDCSYCARSVVNDLKDLKGLESVQIWAMEGLGTITWKTDTPFQCVQLNKIFANSKLLLRLIEVDVEGTIEEKHGTMILHSHPDNSIFYIDNRENLQVSRLKQGQVVRLQGNVTNRQGFNMLYVTNVLPPVDP
jgi:copper chaperone CopZ